jgi:hypothetical protein
MPDPQPQTPAWPQVQYPWVNANPNYNLNNYRKLVVQTFGDRSNPDKTQVGPNGEPVYRRGDQSTGTPVIDNGMQGRYHRLQKILGTTGQWDSVPIPLSDMLQKADSRALNPWAANQGTAATPWDPADNSLPTRLQKAALMERWENSHPVDKSNLNQLRTGTQILGAIRGDLANLTDAEISKAAALGADVLTWNGADLSAHGVNPAYQNLLKHVQMAKDSGLFTPATSGAPPNPLSQIIAGGPITGLALAGGNALYDWLAAKPNLTQLRHTVPMDLNKARFEAYNTVAADPNGQWAKSDVDFANGVASDAQKDNYGHDDNPYDPDISKPIPESKTPWQAKPTVAGSTSTDTPAPTPTDTPAPTPEPAVSAGRAVGQGMVNIGKTVADVAKNKALPFFGGVGEGIGIPSGKQISDAVQPVVSAIIPAPVAVAPSPEMSASRGFGIQAPTPAVVPGPAPLLHERAPVKSQWNLQSSAGAPHAGTLVEQEHVDQLPPGTPFDWQDDGNTYVKV